MACPWARGAITRPRSKTRHCWKIGCRHLARVSPPEAAGTETVPSDTAVGASRSAQVAGDAGPVQAVARELRVELLARDAELSGRPDLVAAGQGEGSLDQGPLRLLEGRQPAGGVGRHLGHRRGEDAQTDLEP